MTPEELGRMTLADFEAAAERWKQAGDALREVRALMGAQAPYPPNSYTIMPAPPPVPAPVHPGIADDPESMAIRERLRRQMAMNKPADIPEGLAND